MENYIKTKNQIGFICNQSRLSPTEICGILSEILSEVRNGMVIDATAENARLKAQIAQMQEELAQLKEGNKDDSEEESE